MARNREFVDKEPEGQIADLHNRAMNQPSAHAENGRTAVLESEKERR